MKINSILWSAIDGTEVLAEKKEVRDTFTSNSDAIKVFEVDGQEVIGRLDWFHVKDDTIRIDYIILGADLKKIKRGK